MSWKKPKIENNILIVIDFEETKEDEQGNQILDESGEVIFTKRVIYSFDISDPKKWDDWQYFLDTEKSFRYIYIDPKQKYKFTFSGRKEMRKQWGTRGKEYAPQPYWYAHKYVNNKLRRKYLGVPKNLTAKKLQQVAMEIAQGKLI